MDGAIPLGELGDATLDEQPLHPDTLVSACRRTKGAQGAEVFPLETTRSPVSRPSEVFVNVPTSKSTGYVSQPVSDPSQQRPAEDNLLPSDLASSANQHLPDTCASQASLQGNLPEPGNLLPPNSDALARLKGQDKKEGDFLPTKDRKNKEYLIKSPYLEKLSSAESLAKSQELAASHSASSKDKPMNQQAPHSKTSVDNAEPKPTQLFWGSPSLHSEALHPPTTASSDPSSAFNSMAEASLADNSPPPVTLPTPLFVTKSQPQTWFQTLSQSHSQRDPPAGGQAHPQCHSPVSVLTFSPQSQIKICGVHFHRPQDEAQPLGPFETQHLEYNVLKKEQERVWGLPSVVQKSQKTFCPSPPKLSTVSQSLKSHNPRPILLGDFPLTNELRKKLEHHLRKRLIQHRWGLPHRINESLSLMCPQSELADFPESKRSRGLSWLSLFKHQQSKDSHDIVLNGARKFHSGTLKNCAREETKIKAQTDSKVVGQKDHLQRNPEEALASSLQSHLKTDLEPHAASQSGQLSSLSKVSQCQKKVEIALEQHLNKKMKEIREGQIPSTVDKSWHSISAAQPPPETLLEDLAPLAGEEDPLKNHQHSLSISPSKEKILEEHIKTFGRRMSFHLPKRVEESLESYKTKVEPSHPPSQFHAASHAVSAVNSAQTSRFQQRNTSGDGMRTLNFTPIQEVSLPASWPGSQIRPASEIKVFVDKDLSTAQSGREPIQPWTPGMVDKGSLQQSGSDHRHSPELPMRPDRPTVPHNPRTSDYKSQVSRGVVLHSESRPPIQAAGLPDVPSASEEKTSKPQGPSSGDMVASQVLRVHLPTARVGIEAGQSSWFPANVSGKCQNKGCPPAAKRVSPLGGGDAGLGTSQTRGKRLSVQARAPEETHGHTSSPVQSRRGQPLENQFTSQVKCFLQWVSPGRKHKGQERSLAKGSFSSPPVKGTSLIKGRCEFYENIEALKYVRDPGVILRKPLGHRQGTVIPCPQAPVPPFMGSEETQQEVQLLAQSEPVQRYLSCWQAACSQVQRAEACSPGQGQTVPKRCGTAGKAEMVTSPMQAPQGSRVPPKSCL
ncbi:spermatogenesis-associated protein 31D1-like [Cricetulus griseus]|uniref:spermatogenesis-associated protein 31D1-like n=2 Tax=Cricetulus griseus TaxID=10029 RepID=UPI0004547CD3|nr:spermatogenesis-associated protein 31D1-like [Cricetulus griseus]